jgi:SAM-dependent methyltransferase
VTNQDSDTLYTVDAQFYDLDNRPGFQADIPFYLDYAARSPGPILELACGTGRLTIPLAQAGHEIWALEYSTAMIRELELKQKNLPLKTAGRIHVVHGDMSRFQLDRQFPLILLPARAFQLLLDEEKERACLRSINSHLTGSGYFIMDIANFVGQQGHEHQWVDDSEIFDWENRDPKTGAMVRRTHRKKKIDTGKQIIYPLKTYYIKRKDGTVQQLVKQSAWKYFFPEQIRNRLEEGGFEIDKEFGSYDRKPISADSDFIFVCRKFHSSK